MLKRSEVKPSITTEIALSKKRKSSNAIDTPQAWTTINDMQKLLSKASTTLSCTCQIRSKNRTKYKAGTLACMPTEINHFPNVEDNRLRAKVECSIVSEVSSCHPCQPRHQVVTWHRQLADMMYCFPARQTIAMNRNSRPCHCFRGRPYLLGILALLMLVAAAQLGWGKGIAGPVRKVAHQRRAP